MAIRGLWFALKNPLEIKIVSSVGKCFKSEITLFPAQNCQNPPPFFPLPKTDPPCHFKSFLCYYFSQNNSKLQ